MTLINQDIARSAVHSIGQDKRADIISRARKLRAEIAQTFADAAHWNSINAPHKGPAIDPDPDGELRRIADGLDKMLAAETKLTREQIAPADTSTHEQDEWALGDYDNGEHGCPNCGRSRLCLCPNGKHRCKKCNWCPELGTYAPNLEA